MKHLTTDPTLKVETPQDHQTPPQELLQIQLLLSQESLAGLETMVTLIRTDLHHQHIVVVRIATDHAQMDPVQDGHSLPQDEVKTMLTAEDPLLVVLSLLADALLKTPIVDDRHLEKESEGARHPQFVDHHLESRPCVLEVDKVKAETCSLSNNALLLKENKGKPMSRIVVFKMLRINSTTLDPSGSKSVAEIGERTNLKSKAFAAIITGSRAV